MKPGAPLRFLGLVLIGWIGLRVGVHAPAWLENPEPSGGSPSPPAAPREVLAERVSEVSPATPAATRAPSVALGARQASQQLGVVPAPHPLLLVGQLAPSRPSDASAPETAQPAASPRDRSSAARPSVATLNAPERRISSRWSGSAWLLLRRKEGTPTLAPGGTLGGSQGGMRLLYRLNRDPSRPLALSARAYVPLRRTEGAEAALGLEWRPSARLPLHLLAERRQAVGTEGRSAFALTLHGGHSARLGRLRIDAYGQAGVVGLRARDLFADGTLRVALPIGPVEAGGGLWGAAQPGAARVDAGPQLAVPLRAGRASLRLAAEYRIRLAGDAAPGSGPVLTLGAGF